MMLDEATILIVEDEPQLLKFYTMWFTREGSRVVQAQNGAEGLAMARDTKVDLVITDLRMPVMDGFEMARRMGEHGDFLPKMMFVSGVIDVEDRDLYEIGVTTILRKPIRRQEMVAEARLCLQDKETRWSAPLLPEDGPCQDIDGYDAIAFGNGGFCLSIDVLKLRSRLVRAAVAGIADTPVPIVAQIRWMVPDRHLAGFEIRHVDAPFRAAVIGITQAPGLKAYIPRAVAK